MTALSQVGVVLLFFLQVSCLLDLTVIHCKLSNVTREKILEQVF